MKEHDVRGRAFSESNLGVLLVKQVMNLDSARGSETLYVHHTIQTITLQHFI